MSSAAAIRNHGGRPRTLAMTCAGTVLDLNGTGLHTGAVWLCTTYLTMGKQTGVHSVELACPGGRKASPDLAAWLHSVEPGRGPGLLRHRGRHQERQGCSCRVAHPRGQQPARGRDLAVQPLARCQRSAGDSSCRSAADLRRRLVPRGNAWSRHMLCSVNRALPVL